MGVLATTQHGLIDGQDQIHCVALHYCCTFHQRKLDVLSSAAPDQFSTDARLSEVQAKAAERWTTQIRNFDSDPVPIQSIQMHFQNPTHRMSRNIDKLPFKFFFTIKTLTQFAQSILIIDIFDRVL